MEQVSIFLKAAFVAITLLTVWQFYRATNGSRPFLILVVVWMMVQLLLGRSGFYTNQHAVPSRAMLLILPPQLFTIIFFLVTLRKNYMDRWNMGQLTLLHTIRIPIELVLYGLFLSKAIPEIMTFAGSNFDILAGLSAPLIYYFGVAKHKLSRKMMIAWNILSLCLLANIVVMAILSSKSPFQRFGFDQPNIAIGHFPFFWLPGVVVPIVLISHLATLKLLISPSKSNVH
jgi:hypothetical protein